MPRTSSEMEVARSSMSLALAVASVVSVTSVKIVDEPHEQFKVNYTE